MSQIQSIKDLVARADRLGQAFASAHAQTIPPVLALQQAYHAAQARGHALSEDAAEAHLGIVRDGLMLMERAVNEMIALVFQIDATDDDYSGNASAGNGGASGFTASFNPKEALGHVSDLFHMYQAELFAKRGSLADLTCEEMDIDTFTARWQRLDEVEQGKKQEVDDLADLLAGMG